MRVFKKLEQCGKKYGLAVNDQKIKYMEMPTASAETEDYLQ